MRLPEDIRYLILSKLPLYKLGEVDENVDWTNIMVLRYPRFDFGILEKDDAILIDEAVRTKDIKQLLYIGCDDVVIYYIDNTNKYDILVDSIFYGRLNVIKYINEHYNIDEYKNDILLDGIGYIDVVKYIVEHFKDLDLDNALIRASGANLMISSGFPKFHTMAYLISKGANISTQDNVIITTSVYSGNYDIIKFALENGGSLKDENILDAVDAEDIDMVKFLVSKGCNPRIDNDEALSIACDWGNIGVVKYLMSLGLDPRSNNCKAIKTAAGCMDLKQFKLVTKDGIPDECMDIACEYDNYPVINYLLKEGYELTERLRNGLNERYLEFPN